jgi:hypothetical protein
LSDSPADTEPALPDPAAAGTARAAVAVAPAGWWALADAHAYYPDDLPADWQLTYFANEHPGVYVPLAAWSDLPAATLRRWHEDVHPGFVFYLEWPDRNPAQADAARTALAGNLAGWVRWPGTAGATGELLAPHATATTTPRIGQALHCPPALLADLRGGALWLRAQVVAARVTLVVLPTPTSARLADWRQLAQLLGFAEPGANPLTPPA